MLDERFWSKVDIKEPDECWEWTASKNNQGYGMFSCRGLGFFNKTLAHRLSFANAYGPIPEGKHILHGCDNPACVNPRHLRSGSRSENMVDCSIRFRSKTRRYTADQVTALLRDYVAGGMTREALCSKHSIAIASLSDITGGRGYRWLHGVDGCPTLEEIHAARNIKPGAKITPEIAQEIKDRLALGETGRSIAKHFGLHFGSVSDIKMGKTWR